MAEATAAVAATTTPATTSASQTMAATTTTAAATTSATTQTTTAPEWTSGFNEDMRGYIANKQFQNPGQLADAYRNLEKLRGVPAERLLQLPENMDTPEGRAIWEKLGMPKTAAEYGLEKLMPKEGGDPKLAEWAAKIFHETGLPRNAAEKIITEWNKRATETTTASQENYKSMLTQGDAALKKEWGAAYDQNVNLAKAGMRALELDAQSVDMLEKIQGREKLFKTLQKIGAGVGESGFVAGRPAADGVLAPEQARQKLKELQVDPLWSRRYLSGDSDAKGQMEKLQRMAYPGEFTI